MPGFSLDDIDRMPDPGAEQECLMFLTLFGENGLLDKDRFTHFALGNSWSKTKVRKVIKYSMENGFVVEENGVLKITDNGKTKIGK